MSDDDATVLPFGTPARRPRRGVPPAPAESGAVQGLTSRARSGDKSAAQLAADQAADARVRYAQAQTRQKTARLLASGRVVPARITLALDMRGLEGPDVDTACGAAEPDVDLWECGLTVPAPEQVKLLAALTGFPVAYFYEPIAPGDLVGPIMLCGSKGCESLDPPRVDERGVLHYAGGVRQPPHGWQGALW